MITFEQFYAKYPRHIDRRAAERAFNRLSAKDRQAAYDGIERYRDTMWLGVETKYIPYPSTYLNGRRWEDEPDKPREQPQAAREAAWYRKPEVYGISDEERVKHRAILRDIIASVGQRMAVK